MKKILPEEMKEYRRYVRTASMLLYKAIADVVGRSHTWNCSVEYTMADAYFIKVRDEIVYDEKLLGQLKQRMQEMVLANLEIEVKHYTLEEAHQIFKQYDMKEKSKLFRYRRCDGVNLCYLDGYYDYYYGRCLASVGAIKQFDLIPERGGFYLILPNARDFTVLPNFEKREKLMLTLEETQDWYDQTGISTVGDLNDKICEGDMHELVLMQEAYQERQIVEIAKRIALDKNIKFVMIAGPSSSGKTTFSHRLSIQLRGLGKKPHPIGLDDYFINLENSPLDDEGEPDLESIRFIDTIRFNEDMTALLEGKEIEMPKYNFKLGVREYHGDMLQLGRDDILVIEGIHGLNDLLSHSLPIESKFKIYISALTSLSIDEHNRIASTDNRLLRRIVRDARTRGMSASDTIHMWQSVRRGEEFYIFPFQEEANVMFNSALIYELALLKQFAEPLLFQIPEEDSAYSEAKRLLKFLDYFLGVSSEMVPNNSICREFIGGSCFGA
ncbi:MAG: nucleoside kinase [Lachnospiraceae bacterium]